MNVAVCAITYQRPEGLRRLLGGLNQLTFKKIKAPKIEVIVIDNDAGGSAYSICESMKPDFRWSIRCFDEPRRGIPFARNKAIASRGKADFIAFIDDDEVPDPHWLEELLIVQQTKKADVVAGPVLPYFKDQSVPSWMAKFFERKRHSTGEVLEFAFTNNVLIRSKIFQQIENRFDERFALTGGSDKQFFIRVHRLGYTIIWADQAVVHEWIPQSRTNIKWILQRGYRLGNTDGLCAIDQADASIVQILARIVWRFVKMILAILFIPVSIVLGRYIFLKNLRSVCRSAGIIAGLANQPYQEYRVTHRM
ncbi:MAG: glycosyltransferase family 2 protein [Cyanophyceae cyanobacterium]